MQQLKIIEDFMRRKKIKTRVIQCKTIRESNGIAYSSRNSLLSVKQRKIASQIYKLIVRSKKKILKKNNLLMKFNKDIYKLGADKIDYIKIHDINKLIKPYKKKNKHRIFIAYYLGSTRLIDNI